MKVGCIGLGDIAQKAYLPVLGVQPGVELHLQTRTPATLDRVADSLHLPPAQRHRDLDGLLDAGLDAAFVHAPTGAHPEIVARLLEAGVPTYVDKPWPTTSPTPSGWWSSPRRAAPLSPSASTGGTRPGTRSAPTTRAS